jgi:hypothetical protein
MDPGLEETDSKVETAMDFDPPRDIRTSHRIKTIVIVGNYIPTMI